MADEPDNLILVNLRRIDAKIDGLAIEVREIKERLVSHDETMVSLRREDANRRPDISDRPA